MQPVIEIDNLRISYGAVEAIKGISLHVDKGEVIALIGSNGAGKTTVLRRISGLLGPTGAVSSGTIIYKGKNISKVSASAIAKAGIIQVLEGRRIFPQLTVQENLYIGAYSRRDRAGIENDLKQMFRRFPRLEERKNQVGGTLSGGEQQMLAVARALMAKPKVILLDEPSLGLAPLIVKEIFNIIKHIREEGITILLVEQNSKAALKISDRGYVLETGKIVLEEAAEKMLNNDEIIKSYLGGNE